MDKERQAMRRSEIEKKKKQHGEWFLVLWAAGIFLNFFIVKAFLGDARDNEIIAFILGPLVAMYIANILAKKIVGLTADDEMFYQNYKYYD